MLATTPPMPLPAKPFHPANLPLPAYGERAQVLAVNLWRMARGFTPVVVCLSLCLLLPMTAQAKGGGHGGHSQGSHSKGVQTPKGKHPTKGKASGLPPY